jgi:hypothetical protein
MSADARTPIFPAISPAQLAQFLAAPERREQFLAWLRVRNDRPASAALDPRPLLPEPLPPTQTPEEIK